jgi:hypothetical protein
LRKASLFTLAEAYRYLLMFDEAVAAMEELCSFDAGYRDAPRVLDQLEAERSKQGAFRTAPITMDPVSFARRIIVGEASEPTLESEGMTNDERRTTDDQRRTTNDQRPTTNDERRTTDDERPTKDDGRRTTDDQRPTTNDERRTTDDERPTKDDE